MFRLVLIVTLAVVALQFSLATAEPRDIEGFTYLGPVPTSSNTGLSAKASYYYLSTAGAAWHVALSRCSQMQGKLATPLNPSEDIALRNYMDNSNQAIWTGGYKASTTSPWRWETNNMNMMFENFQNPSCKTNAGLCLSANNLAGGKWGWCGATCPTAYKYVCEF